MIGKMEAGLAASTLITAINERDAEISKLRGRMRVMREWMQSGYELMGPQAWPVWDAFVDDNEDAAGWFDDDGVPR